MVHHAWWHDCPALLRQGRPVLPCLHSPPPVGCPRLHSEAECDNRGKPLLWAALLSVWRAAQGRPLIPSGGLPSSCRGQGYVLRSVWGLALHKRRGEDVVRREWGPALHRGKAQARQGSGGWRHAALPSSCGYMGTCPPLVLRRHGGSSSACTAKMLARLHRVLA